MAMQRSMQMHTRHSRASPAPTPPTRAHPTRNRTALQLATLHDSTVESSLLDCIHTYTYGCIKRNPFLEFTNTTP